MPTTMDFGAPELPAMRLALGLVTGANAIVLAGAQVQSQSTYSGLLPWPHVIGAIPDTFPRPERFVRDDQVYGSPLDYPGGYATTFDGIDPSSGGLHAGVCELHPFRWNGSGMLTVDDHVRYVFDHPGNASPVEMGSAQSAAAALGGVANAGVISNYVTWNRLFHPGYFLFIVPSGYEAALTPLIEQKKKRGFWVTVIHTEDIRHPVEEPYCTPTREVIDAWYAGTPHAADHFCILAGSHNDISPCFAPRPDGYELGTSLTTDDYFGDADGNGINDEGQEIYVGRIPVNGQAEMTTAVARILAYEDMPSPFEEFDHAGLVAWNSADDDRFLTAMNAVATAAYAVPPVFDIIDGGLSYVNNTWIDGVAETDGIVSYDGHAGSTDWWAWNTLGQSYSNASIDALVNHPVVPVIWSFACYSGNILNSECFGKHWLTHDQDGAASFYGATMPSWIYDNGIMARRLFDAVFNRGFTTQGVAIAFEEFGTILETSADNPVQYLLLGDPEMHIRRTNVAGPPYVVQVPPYLVAGPVPPFDVNVTRIDGRPVEGIKVALWKRGVGPGPGSARTAATTVFDEVLDNRYTDAQGNAHFDVPPLSPGTLYVTTIDDDNELPDSVEVRNTVDVDPRGAPGGFRVAGSVARGRVEFLLPVSIATAARVVIFDVSGRTGRTPRALGRRRGSSWRGSKAGLAPRWRRGSFCFIDESGVGRNLKSRAWRRRRSRSGSAARRRVGTRPA
jgi:hypothetical protein